MEINRRAPFFARKETFIQAQPPIIWKIHTDINSWNQWQPAIASSKMDGSLMPGAVFEWKPGGITITSTIEILEPNERIGWSGTSIGTRARHIWMLKPYKNGTLVSTEESMDGWLAQILKVVMPKFLDESLNTWLTSLKKHAESSRNED